VSARIQERLVPIGELLRQLTERHIPRVPGTAVFLTRAQKDAPPVLVWHIKHKSRPARARVILTCRGRIGPVDTSRRPAAGGGSRAGNVARHGPLRLHGAARHPALLRQANTLGCKLKLDDVTYYVGHETVIPRHDGKGLPHLVETLFAYLQRNSMHVSDYFRLPRTRWSSWTGDRNLRRGALICAP